MPGDNSFINNRVKLCYMLMMILFILWKNKNNKILQTWCVSDCVSVLCIDFNHQNIVDGIITMKLGKYFSKIY